MSHITWARCHLQRPLSQRKQQLSLPPRSCQRLQAAELQREGHQVQYQARTREIFSSRQPLASASKNARKGISVIFSLSGAFLQNVLVDIKVGVEKANGTFSSTSGSWWERTVMRRWCRLAGDRAHAPACCRFKAAL